MSTNFRVGEPSCHCCISVEVGNNTLLPQEIRQWPVPTWHAAGHDQTKKWPYSNGNITLVVQCSSSVLLVWWWHKRYEDKLVVIWHLLINQGRLTYGRTRSLAGPSARIITRGKCDAYGHSTKTLGHKLDKKMIRHYIRSLATPLKFRPYHTSQLSNICGPWWTSRMLV